MALCPIGDLSDAIRRHQTEYATQFFGFTPDSIIDTLLGDVTDIVTVNLKVQISQILAGRS